MSTSPLLDSNHFLIPRIQIGKIQKDLLSFALLRNKGFVALLVDFISVILWRLGLDTVFGDFLENKNSSEQKNYTTFIDLPKGTSERNMRIVIFPIMCHLPRGALNSVPVFSNKHTVTDAIYVDNVCSVNMRGILPVINTT